ncbi:MAG: N-acetyl-gamma-glutamyl-phosphate reductase [Phycisphaerales bacterium]|nr:N-acetyl-gamma-glutamyl-phosphate reductase [Phycisphaerales bacterium]
MTPRINVGILGASGYGAGELLRLLTQHPYTRVIGATSTSRGGERIDELHRHLRGFYTFTTTGDLDFAPLGDADHAVVFSALPHAASSAAIAALLDRVAQSPLASKLHVIDLSGDLRIADSASHQRYYPETPAGSPWRGRFAYGLPEVNRKAIAAARHIANPGCLATAAILAAAPLASGDFRGPIVIDAKTGSSGSGRQLKETTHHPTRHADFRAYKPLAHQHEGEILQAWGDPRGERIALSFVAQSMDTSRGIFVTAHLSAAEPIEAAALRERFTMFYLQCPFVRVVDDTPTLQDVVGSNFCDIAVAARGRQIITMAAIDNLVKGMAGAAIQNMNILCGLPETTGLWMPSLRPV